MRWTDEEINRLCELVKQGLTLEELTPSFPGRTLESIRKRCTSLCLKPRQAAQGWTHEENKQLRELCDQGLSRKEIAKIMRRTESSVQSHCHRYGIRPNRMRSNTDRFGEWTAKEEIRLIDMAIEGYSYEEIGEALNRTPKEVERHLPYVAGHDDAPVEHGTLCWECKHAARKTCSWSADLIPVEGWKANKGDVSYMVIECPEFEKG